MKRTMIAAALAAAAGPALAQEVTVRSGEHETFSRLVFYLPEGAEYETTQRDGSFSITFSSDFAFDTDDVFYYIPRARIGDIATAPGRVSLDLACDCVVTVERLSDRIVYLDANDPGTVPAVAQGQDAPMAAPSVPGTTPPPAFRLPLITGLTPVPLLPTGLLGGGTPTAVEAQAHRSPLAGPSRPDTSGTTEAIAEQIARAASQGLLDVDVPADPYRQPSPRTEEPDPEPEPEPTGQAAASGRAHLSVRSSVDEALGRKLGGALSDLGQIGPCLPATSVDVARWAAGPLANVASLRSRVLGEFDRPDPEGVANLARAYIAMTFGAEASHVLTSFKVDVPDRDVLLAMADIVDHGAADEPGRLAGQYDCPNAAAMWAILSQDEVPVSAEIDGGAIAIAFSALPPQLRRHLGPALAERLLAHGDSETAAVVRTALQRAPGDPTVNTELLDAEFAQRTGRAAEADTKLSQVVDDTSGRSMEAVTRLIELRLQNGEPVADEVLSAAEALIYEHRRAPEAQRLRELRIEALATSGRAGRALTLLATDGRSMSGETVDRLRGVAYAEAARLLDDADFLLVAVTAAESLGQSPEEMAARRAVAQRLSRMELYGLASALGVEEGRMAETDRPAAPPTQAAAQVDLGAGIPQIEAPLERTSALIAHSAALRERLAGLLGPQAE